jgi:hypothetical protein
MSDTPKDKTWLLPTPQGALYAYSTVQPSPMQRAVQSLLAGPQALQIEEWRHKHDQSGRMQEQLLENNWIQILPRQVPAPEVRLDDFAQHVIAPLSGERRAVLASDSGFCLGQSGLTQDMAETLSAAVADFASYAERQKTRGWDGARYVSFYAEPNLLLPEWSFIPFWVDNTGYWLILAGEPLLNNLAMIELLWSIRLAGERFVVSV